MATDDSIVFKKIMLIPEEDLKSLLEASKELAKEHNLKQSDIAKTIKAVRSQKRKKTAAKRKTSAAKTQKKTK